MPHFHENGHSYEKNFQAATDPFLTWINKTYCQKKKGGKVELRLISFDSDEEDIIYTVIDELESQNKGVFMEKHRNRNTIQYFCERHSKPTGKKKGALLTRANGCPAYVSFRFITKNSKKAVIIRTQLKHEGHDQENSAEKRMSRTDPLLLSYIEGLLEQGRKPSHILVSCSKWSRSRGKTDVQDRRYFPTPVDIKNISQSYKRRKRYHTNDAVSVDYLCGNLLKESILFYQPLIETSGQPLIIVYQNAQQRHRMVTFGNSVVFLDATYKGVTSYGYAFYCLIARDENGRGSPISYMIASDDTCLSVEIFLRTLKENATELGFCFQPRSFMVDRDMKEIGAIKMVFPACQVLLCWFHVLQKETFDEMAAKLKDEMPTSAITNYIHQNWIPIGDMWSHFGRRFYHEDQDTNNLVERFFLGLKYHFLGGYSSVRVDELLLLLHENVATFYNYMEDLAKAGRLPNTRVMRESRGRIAAENLLASGIGAKITWIDDVKCQVPSQSNNVQYYNVDIARATCTCPASTQGGHCKHFHLASLVAVDRGIMVEEKRKLLAEAIVQRGDYFQDSSNLEIYDEDGESSVISLTNVSCTCFAYSYGMKCICMYVLEIVGSIDKVIREESFESEVVPEKLVNITPKQKLKTQIEEMYTWVHSKEFDNCDDIKNIKEAVNQAHLVIFNSKFRKITRKRKIEKLHPNRKHQVKTQDHIYAAQKQKKIKLNKNEDGSFRRKNRQQGSIRKHFC